MGSHDIYWYESSITSKSLLVEWWSGGMVERQVVLKGVPKCSTLGAHNTQVMNCKCAALRILHELVNEVRAL